jgi:hypothetical protein
VKFCIHVPMFDRARPKKMIRNLWYDNAARAVPGWWPCGGGVRISAVVLIGAVGS